MVRAQDASPAVSRAGFELVPAPEPQAGGREPGPRRRPGTAGNPRSRPSANPPAQPGAADQPPTALAPPRRRAPEQQIQFDRNGLVTMHVNELDVRQLLELLSRRSGLNILVSPKVSGTITANFENTSVDAGAQSGDQAGQSGREKGRNDPLSLHQGRNRRGRRVHRSARRS